VCPKWILSLWYVQRKTMHQSFSNTKTLQTDRNEIPHDPGHLRVLSVCPKWFSSLWYVQRKLCTYLALRIALSPNRPKRPSTLPTSPRCSIRCVQNDFQAYGKLGASRAPILLQYYDCLQKDWNEIPHDPGHQGVLSGVSKAIFETVVCSAQTVHLSCVKNSTISKRTETSIHLTHVS
jgi:hypothetical protein